MSIYSQQVNHLMEQLPIDDQKLFLEFLINLNRKNKLNNTSETTEKMPNQKAAVNNFIETINAITDEPHDEEFDEIIKSGITLRTPEELGL